jgi:O-antigen ligase
MIAEQSISTSLWLVGGVGILIVTFLQTRVAIYLIIFSMLLSPELGTGVAAGDRPVTIRLEDLLILVVGLTWLIRTAYTKEFGLLKKSPLNRQIFVYSLAALIATLVSGWTSEINWTRALLFLAKYLELFLAKYLEYFVLYFMVLTNVRTRNDIKNYLAAALLTCVLVALIGIAQIPGGGRVSGPFEGETGEPNTFGGYLVLMLAIVSGFYLTSSAPRERLAWTVFGGLLLMPLLFTLSRSSWIAGIGLIIALLIYAPHKRQIAVAGALAIVLFPLLAPNPVIERIDYTFNQPESRGQLQIGGFRLDTSSSARIESWKIGLRGWTERPLTGHGVANYYFMDAQYMRTLTEAGILGLLAFLWLAWAIWCMARDRLMSATDRFSRGLSLGYLGGYVAMLIHGIGANTFIIVRIMEPFWLLTALVVALPLTEELEKPSKVSLTIAKQQESPA